MGESRPTPAPVALRLRQESGFGCCKCGNPIIEYHHIIPWEQDEHFRIEDMMCLCPNCHTEVQGAGYSIEKQRVIKEHPFNKRLGHVHGQLHISQDDLETNIGGSIFRGEGPILLIDKKTLLAISFENGEVSLSLKLLDNEDKLILEIDRNQWISGDYFPWDIKWKFRILTIRSRERLITLRVDASKNPLVVTGIIQYKGHVFVLKKDSITINGVANGSQFKNIAFTDTMLNINTLSQAIEIHNRISIRKAVQNYLRTYGY